MDDLNLETLTQERITILTDSFDSAAMEFHKRRMATKGYRLESRIAGHHFYITEGQTAKKLFDGEVKYAVTFIRED
ncbi:MAG: AMP nucleosidase [Candidatus Puniceispirillaceae bacterium]